MTSLFILEGNTTITKIPSLVKRLRTLSYPTFNSLKEFHEIEDLPLEKSTNEKWQEYIALAHQRISGKSPSTLKAGELNFHESQDSHSTSFSNKGKKHHFLFESPLTETLRHWERTASLDQDTVPDQIIENAVKDLLIWRNALYKNYDTIKMILLTTEDHIAFRRIGYEWEWTQSEFDLLEKKRYQKETRMKELWDSYFNYANKHYEHIMKNIQNQSNAVYQYKKDINLPQREWIYENDIPSLWDLKTPSDDSRQCIWLLLAQLGIEYESFGNNSSENRQKHRYRGSSFDPNEFI